MMYLVLLITAGLTLFNPVQASAFPNGEIEETMSPTALQIIGDWILEQTE
jgi:hypothetical protein